MLQFVLRFQLDAVAEIQVLWLEEDCTEAVDTKRA